MIASMSRKQDPLRYLSPTRSFSFLASPTVYVNRHDFVFCYMFSERNSKETDKFFFPLVASKSAGQKIASKEIEKKRGEIN